MTRRPLNVGESVTVTEIAIRNDVGGTSLARGDFRVSVNRVWHDYETGWKAEGRLTREGDIKSAREAGITGCKPQDYAKYSPGMQKDVYKAAQEFDPARVFISEFSIK